MAPLLPYFSSMFLLISFCCWLGYLSFILHDAAGADETERRVVVRTSVVGKLILAGAHTGVWFAYMKFFPNLAQPNWVQVFLAAQAWWDVLLVLTYQLYTTVR